MENNPFVSQREEQTAMVSETTRACVRKRRVSREEGKTVEHPFSHSPSIFLCVVYLRCVGTACRSGSAVTAASTEPPPTACASLPSWDVSWILLLLFTAGQGVTILALIVVLWRRRARGSQDRGGSLPSEVTWV